MRKLFSRLNPHVQAVSGWIGLLGTVVSAFYAVLSRGIALFGHPNWSESILLGIALTLVTGLVVATVLLVAALAYRLWKMLPTASAPAEPMIDKLPEAPIKNYDAEIASLSVDMASLTNGYGARFHALDQEIKRLNAVSDASLATIGEVQKMAIRQARESREALKEHEDKQAEMNRQTNMKLSALAEIEEVRGIQSFGLQVLLAIAGSSPASVGWDAIKSNVSSFVGKVTAVRLVEPDEGFWMPYFTGKAVTYVPRDEAERVEMEYRGNRGMVSFGLQKLDRALSSMLGVLEKIDGE